MNANIHVHISGTVTLIREPAGASPPLTLADLDALGVLIVSQLLDKIAAADAALGAKIDDATTRVRADVAALNRTIADLRAQLQAAGATPEEIAAFDAFAARAQSRVDAIDPTVPATLPPDQGTPTPTPAP